MSIRDEINARVAEGQLLMMVPMLAGASQPRVIFVTSELFDQISGPRADSTETAKRMGRLRADFDHFSTGGLIVVSSGREGTAYMKQLDPPENEIWEIRSRDPKPSLRVFGRFADTDVFVATNMLDRRSLGEQGSRAWRDECIRCGATWRRLFPTYGAHTGANINEYISSDVVDLRRFE